MLKPAVRLNQTGLVRSKLSLEFFEAYFELWPPAITRCKLSRKDCSPLAPGLILGRGVKVDRGRTDEENFFSQLPSYSFPRGSHRGHALAESMACFTASDVAGLRAHGPENLEVTSKPTCARYKLSMNGV